MNPMRTTKLIAREWMIDGRRVWQSAGFAVASAVLGFGLAGGFPAAAQQPDAAAQTAQTNDCHGG